LICATGLSTRAAGAYLGEAFDLSRRIDSMRLRPTPFLAAALALAVTTPALADGPQTGAVAFKLGKLDLVALHDAQFSPANDGKTFGIDAGPAAVSEVLKAAGAPTDVVTLSIDALLVKDGKQIVLIDTGTGGALQQSLALAKIDPASVTDILITHAHPDHIGGLVKDGQLAFPHATIHMSAVEWVGLQAQADQAALVKAISTKVKPFAPGAVVAPGITAISLPGHTPGHVGYEIVSGRARLLDIGDIAHSSIVSLAKPQWQMGYDSDKAAGRAERIAELTKLAKSHEQVFAPHFPFPGVGKIDAQGDHFVWKPELSEK
jgi:glyoxylase-like metal-dependent hydrolase (beta-lactamase superfamily II)